jgi:hypothetical protein
MSYSLIVNNKSSFVAEASCKTRVPVEWLRNKYVTNYDKDGYELTQLEKQLYKCQGLKLSTVLNKRLLASEWMYLEDDNLYLEHCMILSRCDFVGAALSQLTEACRNHRLIRYLLGCRRKWGLDVALDYIGCDGVFEVLHFEFDSYELDVALEYKAKVEEFMLGSDLNDIATQIKNKWDEWSKLEGYNQNLWKAKYLGFDCSERTQKSI